MNGITLAGRGPALALASLALLAACGDDPAAPGFDPAGLYLLSSVDSEAIPAPLPEAFVVSSTPCEPDQESTRMLEVGLLELEGDFETFQLNLMVSVTCTSQSGTTAPMIITIARAGDYRLEAGSLLLVDPATLGGGVFATAEVGPLSDGLLVLQVEGAVLTFARADGAAALAPGS